MRTAANLLADLLPILPGVPQPRLDRALVRAAQELCRRSRCWTVWTDAVTTQEGVDVYDMELPMHAQVVSVERMTVDGRPRQMLPWSFSRVAPPSDDAPGDTAISRPQIVPGRLQFSTTPGFSSGVAVRFRVVLAPTDDAPGVDDAVFDQNSSTLASGVASLVMADPGQPWSNPQLAQVYSAQFDSGAARATLSQWRGATNETPRSRVVWC